MTFLEATAAPASVPAVPARPVHFTGNPHAYWRLLIRGAVLLAITLGIYRFWLATDIRRFLWAHTDVNGESLEYTGTAVELLLGFLIAIALLVPIYAVFFLLTLSMGPIGQFISALSLPALAFLGQYAIYRARRYRLTRTVFRGVRFHQTGSAFRYAVCAIFWWMMIALTVGLAYPFAQASLERFKLRNTYYGNLAGRFEGSGFRLFLRGLPMWLLVVGPFLFTIAVAIATVDWTAVAELASRGGNDLPARIEGASPGFYVVIVVAITASVVSVAMAAILFPAFQAMTLRWWASGVRFGNLATHSRLRTGQIYGAYLRFLLYGLLLLIAAAVLAGIGYAVLLILIGATARPEIAEIATIIGGLISYVFVMLGFSTIYQGTVKLALWRHGIESLEIEGLDVLDHVEAGGAASSAVGEGLADALNVGGF